MNIAETIEKLIQLALHNPDREEAASAALKAVTLLDKFQIPIGADVTVLRGVDTYKPPTAEEMSTINDLLSGKEKQWQTAADYAQQHHEGKGEGLITQDNTPMTGQDAFRQRLVDAWRALREERVKLQGEIHRYEQETRRKYQGEGRPF